MGERISGRSRMRGWRSVTLGAVGLLMTTAGVAFAPLSAPAAGAAPAPLAITTTSVPDATVNSPYSFTVEATGGTPPYSWQWGIDPRNSIEQLPPGLSFSAGTISGIPTQYGEYEFYVFVGDSSNPQEQSVRTVTLTVITTQPLVVTTTSVPAATLGSPYSATLQATGGIPPYSWSVASGSLPNGLSLSPSGTISGTPQLPQTSSFGVQVVDTGGANGTTIYSPQQQANQPLSITVGSGTPSLDSALQSLGNEIVAAGGSVTGAIASVEAAVGPVSGTVQGLVGTLGVDLQCLPGLLNTVLGKGPPFC
jgi:hypothetical protein